MLPGQQQNSGMPSQSELLQNNRALGGLQNNNTMQQQMQNNQNLPGQDLQRDLGR